MNARGTYGRQTFQPYGLQVWNAPMPVVGVDTKVKKAVAEAGFLTLMTLVSTLGGVWLGKQVTPKDPSKGGLIGGAVGYFAFQTLRQNFALERIADHTARL